MKTSTKKVLLALLAVALLLTGFGNFILVYIELRGLYLLQLYREDLLWRKLFDQMQALIVKTGDMGGIEAKVLNERCINLRVSPTDYSFTVGNDFNLIGGAVYKKTAMLIEDFLGKAAVLIGIYSCDFHTNNHTFRNPANS